MRKIITEALYEVDLLGERGDIVSAEGLPYLGNKGRLFDWILRTIERDRGMTNDKVGIPFCGGGSDTIGFVRNGYRVKANDLNKGVVDLLERVTQGDELVQLWAKEFITREQFEELKDSGRDITVKDIEEEIIKRDAYDSSRLYNPLRKAEDAIEIDTSDKDIYQVVDLLYKKYIKIVNKGEI